MQQPGRDQHVGPAGHGQAGDQIPFLRGPGQHRGGRVEPQALLQNCFGERQQTRPVRRLGACEVRAVDFAFETLQRDRVARQEVKRPGQ